MKAIKALARIALSFVVGVLLLIPISMFYGAFDLAVFHSWGLMHGSATTALPATIVVGYIALGYTPWFTLSPDPIARILSSLLVFPLVTLLFWANQNGGHDGQSVFHIAVYVACAAIMAWLCFRAERPWLVPLFLLAPVVCDEIFQGVLLGFHSAFLQEDFNNKILPLIGVGCVALAVTYLVRAMVKRGKTQ